MATMSSRFFREDFDRRRDFIATRSFKYDGVDYTPGRALDKSKFSDRRLRQLYDMRNIGYPEQLPTLKTMPAFLGDQSKEKAVVITAGKPKVERYRPTKGVARRRSRRASSAQEPEHA